MRAKLERGRYEAESNLSRSEYLIRLNNDIKFLTHQIPGAQVVQMFARHFDQQIEIMVTTGLIKYISKLIKLLDNLDAMGSLNSETTNSRVDYSRVSLLTNSRGNTQTNTYASRRKSSNKNNFWGGMNNFSPKINSTQVGVNNIEVEETDGASTEDIIIPEN